MPEPQLSLYGDRGLMFYLKGVRYRGSANLRPVLQDIGESMLRSERRLFATRGVSGGVPWLASVSDKEPGKPISLVASGFLRASLTVRGAPGNIFNITRSSIFIGTRADYAEAHMKGYHRGDQEVPPRPPIQFTEVEASEHAERLAEWIIEGKLRRPRLHI